MEHLALIKGQTITAQDTLIEDEKSEQRSNRTKLYELIEAFVLNVVKSADDPDQVVVLVEIQTNQYWFDVTSSDFEKLLRVKALENFGDIFTNADYQSAIKQFHSKHTLFNSDTKKVFQRFAYLKNDNAIYYDPYRKDCKLVKVTINNVELIDYDTETNPIFIKNPNTWIANPHLEPIKTDQDPLSEFADLFHISEDDKLLFKVHLITFFLSGFPIPIMVFNGEQGTAKSTVGKSIKYMLDPDRQPLLGLPEKIEDMIISASKRALICYDNMGGIKEDQSNELCRMVTGGGSSKRALYTNSDEIILILMSKIIMNGISPGIHKPDLLRRCVLYELKPIAQKDKKTDEEITEKLEVMRPIFLGQVFDILQKALQIRESVKKSIEEKPTMADWAIWGEAISQALGSESNQFINKYLEKIKDSNAALVARYPLLDEILAIVEQSKEGVNCTVKELYNKLLGRCKSTVERSGNIYEITDHEKQKIIPKNAAELGKQIKVLAPVLRSLKFTVEQTLDNKRASENRGSVMITIRKSEGGSNLDSY